VTYGHAHLLASGPWCWCGKPALVILDDGAQVCPRHALEAEGLRQ